MKLAVIFNGQGAHYEEMGQDFSLSYPEAQKIYEQSEEWTNTPIRHWITDEFDALAFTKNAQIAIAATSLAIYKSVESQLPAISYMAGLSLGEYTALMASGMLDIEEGIKLLKIRGELMSDHCEFLKEEANIVMQAMMKIPLEELKTILEKVNMEYGEERVFIANLNSSTQTVIGGEEEAVAKVAELSKEAGYRRSMPLKVEGPFHTPYMQKVQEPYREALSHVTWQEGQVPVISNTNVSIHTPDDVTDTLVRHLVEPVRWEETIAKMVEEGITHLIQIGPGKTLAGLLKREVNAPEVLVIDKVEDVASIEDFIGG